VIIALAISWILFRMRLRVPVSKKIADCSYSLYVIHFPVLILAQSLLLSFSNRSVGMALCVAVLSSLAVIGLTIMGGRLEAKKSVVQSYLLMSVSRVHRMAMGLK